MEAISIMEHEEPKRSVTTAEIEAKILHEFRWEKRCMPVCPTIELFNFFEADVAAVTKTGFVHEIEIKVSRSDFLADFKKSNSNGKKHEILQAKGDKNPNYFWFATPKGLLKESDIPHYAGWIEVRWEWFSHYPGGKNGYFRLFIEFKKNAPRLHGAKVTQPILNRFMERLTNIVTNGRTPKAMKVTVNEPELSLF